PLHKWFGIPPQEQPPNHYRLLGIALYESNADVIDTAADKQMTFLHGCANGEHAELAEALMNQVSAARLCLLNPAKRALYDAALHNELDEPAAQVSSPQPQIPQIPRRVTPPAAPVRSTISGQSMGNQP